MKNVKSLLFLALLFTLTHLRAQVTGTVNIPGTYTDLAAAFAALNTQGVGSGGATININAGQICPLNGFQLGSATLNASLSAANPLVINGNNNSITAYAGTRTGSVTSGINDGMIILNGADNVTFNNLIFNDLPTNTTNVLAMEHAIGMYNRTSTTGSADGCKYISINGCTFNLSNASGGGAVVAVMPYVWDVAAVLVWETTSDIDIHRSIVVNNCNFANFFTGVHFRGTSTKNAKSLIVTNNTFTNIGGGASNTGYGVYMLYLDSIIYNSNISTGDVTHSTTSYHVSAGTSCGGFQQANNNTLTLQSNTSTSATYGINMLSIGGNREINFNTLNFGSFPSITSGLIYGLYGTYSGGNNNITLQMNNNIINNQTLPPTTTTTFYLLYNNATTGTNRVIEMKNNTITNLTKSNSGAVACLYVGTANVANVSGNIINNINFTNNSTSGVATLRGIYGFGSPTLMNVHDNTVSNLTISGSSTASAGLIQGILSNTTANGTGNIYSNNINNLSFGAGVNTGIVSGIYLATNLNNVYKNNINNLSVNQASGLVRGIEVNSGNEVKIYNNFISSLSAPQANSNVAISGIHLTGGVASHVSYNTIYPSSAGPLTSAGALFGATGIFYSSTATNVATVKNNIINITGTANGDAYISAIKRAAIGVAGTKPTNFIANSNIYNATYIYGEGPLLSTATNVYYVTGGTTGTADPTFNTTCGLYKIFMGETGTFTENNLTSLGAGQFVPSGVSFAQMNGISATNPTITDDYNSITRATFADVGALEFSGPFLDATAPTIVYTPLTSTICTNMVPLSATITDPSGVNSTSGTNPRLYFKKSTDNNVLAATNTAASNGWKYIEASNASSPYIFNIDFSIIFGGSVTTGDVINYFVTAQDLATVPNVATNQATYPAGFCPTSAALPFAAFPVSGFLSFNVITTPTSVTTLTSNATLCISDDITLSLGGDPVPGAQYQWQSSPAGANTWTNIPGATSSTYSAMQVSSSTDYRCIISCGGVPIAASPSTPVSVTVLSPEILTTTPAVSCVPGPISLALSATANAGSTIKWYDVPTGGTAIATGGTFNTPAITSTTTYYVSAAIGSTTESVGKPSYTATDNTSGNAWGLVFDVVNTATVINSVDVFSVGTGGSMIVELRDNTGALVTSVGPFSYPAGSTGSPVLVTFPLNLPVPVGTGWRLQSASMTGALIRNSSGNTYPYTSPSGNVSITSGFITNPGSTTYYWFYNWVITSACESERVPVTAAIVTSNPVCPPNMSVCLSDPTFNLSGATPEGGTYSGTGVVGNQFNPATAGVGTHAITYTVCGLTCTFNITVTQASPTIVFTENSGAAPNDGVVCAGASATLTATASSAYAWSTGATTQSITVSTAGTYTVTVTNSLGCLGSTSATVSNSPAPASSFTVVQPTTCISTNGSIDLTITTPGTYTYIWSNGATTQDLTGVPVGDYVVTVTDQYTCTHILMQSLIGPGGCSVCPTMPAAMTFAPTSACANANFTMTVNGMANLGVTYGVTFKRFSTTVVDPYTAVGGTVLTTVSNSNLTNAGSTAVGTSSIATPGTYYIYAILDPSHPDPSCRPFSTASLIVNSLPTAGISVTENSGTTANDGIICNGSSATLTGTGGTSYLWSTGASTTSITVSAAGTYTVTVTSALGCTASTSRIITVNPVTTPINTITEASGTAPNDGNICQGSSATIACISMGTFMWSNGATTSSISVNTSGTYTVTLTNSNGCTATASSVITVNPLPAININITETSGVPNDGTIIEGSSADLTASGGGTYRWSTNATTASINVSPLVTTTYTVTVTNSNGCTASASKTIAVVPPPCLIVCAGDQNVTLAPGACDFTIPNFATFVDQCDIYTIVQTAGPIAGANVGPGTYLLKFELRRKNNGLLVDDCELTLTVVGLSNPIASLACKNHVNISIDQNCQVTLNADMFLEGGPYACYWDYQINIWPNQIEANAINDVPQGVGFELPIGNHTFEIIGLDGNKCWGTFTVEDKLPPVLSCNCLDNPVEVQLTNLSGTVDINGPKLEVSTISGACNKTTTANRQMPYALIIPFTVTAPGSITFAATSTLNTSFPFSVNSNFSYQYIYSDVPNPADLCDNYVYAASFTSSGTWTPTATQLASIGGQFVPGVTYYYVFASAYITNIMNYNITFTHNNGGQLITIQNPADAKECQFKCYDIEVVKRETVSMLYNIPPLNTNKSKLTTPISYSDCGDVKVVFKDRILPSDCNGTKLIRDWTVTDAKGNSAVCSQTFTFNALEIDSLTPPRAEVLLSCGLETTPAAISGYLDIDSRTGTLSATNIGAFADDWSATPGVVELNEGYEYGYYTYKQIGFDGKMHAQKVDMNICNIYTSFSDVMYPVCGLGCGGNMKVVRTWKLLDWCTKEVREYHQIIKAVDQKAPTFTVKDVTVSVDPWECQANYKVDKPWELEDNCAKIDELAWGVNVAPGLTVSGTKPNFTISGLEKGVHEITYWAQDCCGNYSEQIATVTVIDGTGPIPVAKQNIVMSLTGSGTSADGSAKLYGWQIDNGSYDQCTDVRFEVRRVDGGSCGNVGVNGHNNNSTFNGNNEVSEIPGAVWFHPQDSRYTNLEGNFDTDNGEFVKFCCEDIPTGSEYGLHDVELRVWDDGNMNGVYGDNYIIDGMKDNYNTTWVTVRVENKLPPALVCPPDVTVTCDMELNLSLDKDTKVSDVNLTMTGYPTAYDLCTGLDISYKDTWIGLHDPICKAGTFRRVFTVKKGSVVVTCTQFITVSTITVPFTVTFPQQNLTTEWDKCSFTLDDARDATNPYIKRPIVNYSQCDIVGENITIDTFLFEDGACKKWRVKYSYKNWCTGEEINTIGGSPIVHWYAFKDVTAPVLACSNQMFAANPNPLNPNGGCEAAVALEASASDALICAEESWIKWQMFFDGWNNGTVDRLGSSFVNKSWNGIWVPQTKYIAGVLNPTWIALQDQHPNLPLADLVYVTYIKPTKASGETVKLPVGTGITAFILNAENISHKVLWKVTDGCGNVDQCESTVMVVDKKAPTPYCVSVSTALMQTDPQMVELWARDFDKGAFDNCSPQSKLYFTFDEAAPIYSRVNEEHFYKVVGGVSVNATAAEYAQGKAYKWLPSSRSAGKVWTASGDYELHVSVWDEAWNTDYCTVTLKIRTKAEGSRIIAGNVSTMFGSPLSGANVVVDANLPEYPKSYITDLNGNYSDAHQIDFAYDVTFDFNGDYLNGVSTLDLVMIQRHILGTQSFDIKYKHIAADANKDGKVTASDLTELRKLILGIVTRIPNKSWRFPLKNADVNLNPITFTENGTVQILTTDVNEDAVAVKIGDVNGSAITSLNGSISEPRTSNILKLFTDTYYVDKGQVVEIPVYSSNFSSISGFQYTMNLNGASFVGINGGAIEMNASNVGVLSGDVLTMSYANDEPISANEGEVLFTLVVKADKAMNVSEMLSISSDVTRAESYNGDLKVGGVSLSVRTAPVASIELFQNEPNPFKGQTTVMFTMPEAATVTLSVHDVTGKVVAVRNISAMKGQNSEVFTKDQLGVSGVLYYTLKSGDFTATKKMIIVE